MKEYITMTWIIYLLTFIACLLVGLYIYINKKLREQVNLKEVWKLLLIVMILRIFDVISTIYFTNKIGIEYEGNLVARTLMTQFGIIPGMIMIYISTIPLMFFWFIIVNYIFKNKKIGWKIFSWIMIAIGIIVPIVNFSA